MKIALVGYRKMGHEVENLVNESEQQKKITSIILEKFPDKKEPLFAFLRMGRLFGYHEVIFDASANETKLSHNAHSRRDFAQSAITAIVAIVTPFLNNGNLDLEALMDEKNKEKLREVLVVHKNWYDKD